MPARSKGRSWTAATAAAIVAALAATGLAMPSTLALLSSAANGAATATVSNEACQNEKLVDYANYLTTYLGGEIYYPLTEAPAAGNPLTVEDALSGVNSAKNATIAGTHGADYYLAAPAGSGTTLDLPTCVTSRGVLLKGGTFLQNTDAHHFSLPTGVGMWVRVDAAPTANVPLVSWGGQNLLTLTPGMTLLPGTGTASLDLPLGEWTYVYTYRTGSQVTVRTVSQALAARSVTGPTAYVNSQSLKVGPHSGAGFEMMLSDVSVNTGAAWTEDQVKDLVTLTPPLSVSWPNTTAKLDVPVSIPATVVGAIGATTFSTSSTLPPGLSLNKDTGEISGTINGLRVSKVSVGSDHACGILKTNSNLYCWGSNEHGATGQGTTVGSTDPAPVKGALAGRAVVDVSVSRHHSCAVRSDKTLWCWGRMAGGTVASTTNGIPLFEALTLPTQVTPGGVRTFKTVETASYFDKFTVSGQPSNRISNATCAIADTADGSNQEVYCFGANTRGVAGQAPVQGGLGMTAVAPANAVPVKADGGITPIKAKDIAVGGGHACAIKADDTMACWGSDSVGQLGNGAPAADSTTASPVAWAGSAGVRSIAANRFPAGSYNNEQDFTCAVKLDGTVWCWGVTAIHNLPQQTGQSMTKSSIPSQIKFSDGSALVATSIELGADKACALSTTNGTYCWGAQFYGGLGVPYQAGNLDLVRVAWPTPMLAPFGTAPAEMMSIGGIGCGTLVGGDGQLYCWGTGGPRGDGLTGYQPPTRTGLLGALPKLWKVVGRVEDEVGRSAVSPEFEIRLTR